MQTTHRRGFYGTDSFLYSANDGVIAVDVVATVYIVIPAPPLPIANPNVFACASLGRPCTIPFADLLANDNSPSNCSMSVDGTPTASQGNLTRSGNGSFIWTGPA